MTKRPDEPCTVERTDSALIGDQIMVSLSDKSKVALVLDVHDLNAIIDALANVPCQSSKQRAILRDIEQLRDVAFPNRKR
jgi:hypothetical protein